MANIDNLQERLIDFAVRVIKISAYLPKTTAGKHLAKQLVRSGAAASPHFARAYRAENATQTIAQLKICLNELNETRIWLKIITKSDMLTEDQVHSLAAENDKLCQIVEAQIKTARSNPTTPPALEP